MVYAWPDFYVRCIGLFRGYEYQQETKALNRLNIDTFLFSWETGFLKHWICRHVDELRIV